MYKGRWFIRESVYICGDYMDADIYPVFQTAGKRRKKCNPTSEIQEKLNQRNAEKKITRLVHNNFSEKDIALHLTYTEDNKPENRETAQKDLYNFIRRLKRRYAKAGIELKYISCTEYGKVKGRIHHHMLITGGIDRDEIEKLWGKGYANSKRLQFGEDGVSDLAKYMIKDRDSYRRWNRSKNLTIPEPIVRDGAVTIGETAAMAYAIESKSAWEYFSERYPGFELTDAAVSINEVNRNMYIHVDMRKGKIHDSKKSTFLKRGRLLGVPEPADRSR